MYKVLVRPYVWKDLEPLPEPLKQRLLNEMTDLGKEPRPRGCKKLAGSYNSWRVRVGDYRILYVVDDRQKIVVIYRVRHRKDVYRLR
jgi:mRNA interferase RelE/StbE